MSKQYSMTELINFTAAGVTTASFPQIRDAIVQRYKEVYGQDIDLSTSSADGVFVNDLALILNNILQASKIAYGSLDARYASGAYLDNICQLANIKRKQASKSSAWLTLRNISSSNITIEASSLANGVVFLDKGNNEWEYFGETITLKPFRNLESTPDVAIQVFSKEVGEVEADAGWITTAIGEPYISVSQERAAVVGSNQESDSELRYRRSKVVNGGLSSEQGLVAALLNVESIEDVLIVNNNSDSDMRIFATYGDEISPGSICIFIKRRDGIILDEDDVSGTVIDGATKHSSTIGSIIYEKLTPGVRTYGFGKSFGGVTKCNYTPPKLSSLTGTTLVENISSPGRTSIYWLEVIKATSLPASASPIQIKVRPLDNFNASTLQSIKTACCNYLNSLPINGQMLRSKLFTVATHADPQYFGNPTIAIVDVLPIYNSQESTKGGFNNDVYYRSNPVWAFNVSDVLSNEDKTIGADGLYTVTILPSGTSQ